MKIAVYDPLTTFTSFAEWSGRNHDVSYIPFQMGEQEREALHYTHDVVWYEFCTPEFVADTNRLNKMAYTVCRLHSYELFTQLPAQAKWDRVEQLMVVSPYVKGLLENKQNQIDFPPMSILFNGVDLDKFTPPKDKVYGKNIAVVGFINYKKNLPMAIQCLDAVREDGYHMHFIGKSQDRRFDMYLRHIIDSLGLGDQTHFHGEIPHDDLPAVLREMDYIASFSLFESFGQGIMEGIASGCIPLVHDFPGALARFGRTFKTRADFAHQLRGTAGFSWGLTGYSLATAKEDLAAMLDVIAAEVGK